MSVAAQSTLLSHTTDKVVLPSQQYIHALLLMLELPIACLQQRAAGTFLSGQGRVRVRCRLCCCVMCAKQHLKCVRHAAPQCAVKRQTVLRYIKRRMCLLTFISLSSQRCVVRLTNVAMTSKPISTLAIITEASIGVRHAGTQPGVAHI